MTQWWGGGHPGKLGVVAVLSGFCALLVACGTEVSNQTVTSGTTLCRTTFETCIIPIFNLPIRRNSVTGDIVQCASGGCHEVGTGFGGSFKVYANATAATELRANYLVSLAFSNLSLSTDSKLLLEPLAGSSGITGSHTGGDVFRDNNDPCYIAINNWIAALVDDPEDASCRVCAAPPTGCGY